LAAGTAEARKHHPIIRCASGKSGDVLLIDCKYMSERIKGGCIRTISASPLNKGNGSRCAVALYLLTYLILIGFLCRRKDASVLFNFMLPGLPDFKWNFVRAAPRPGCE
jgi:hypothetical protein